MMCCSTALVTVVGALKLPFAQIGLTAKLHQFIPPVVLGFGACLLYVWFFISWKHLKKIVSPGPAEWSSEYKRLLSCSCWCVCVLVRCMHAWFSLGIARPHG